MLNTHVFKNLYAFNLAFFSNSKNKTQLKKPRTCKWYPVLYKIIQVFDNI